tara:strand:+ start:483 stop:902 length:420 start_codon:yes stop_codon:yes gene_type:complete
MRTVYRPFTKIIEVAPDTTVNVELRDSNANVVNCNFVSVESASGTASDGFIFVQPTSGITASSSVATTALTPNTADGSGMLGVACPNLNGICQLVLGVGDRVMRVSLINTGDTATTCVITYGNVNVQNPIKDVGYGRGS